MECVLALVLALTEPGEWGLLRSIAASLHYPAVVILSRFPGTNHDLLVHALVQWLIWFFLFSVIFLFLNEWRKIKTGVPPK